MISTKQAVCVKFKTHDGISSNIESRAERVLYVLLVDVEGHACRWIMDACMWINVIFGLI